MRDMDSAENRLHDLLAGYGPLAIAVSGGVDSMTLATLAHRFLETSPLMVHAFSPAVPAGAGDSVRRHAEAEGWSLSVLTAGEFDDLNYRANPRDRCYFCKSSLYRAIATVTERVIASGTNFDDLSDYRPGLKAAEEHGVVHPFVDACIDKDMIRALARRHGLSGFADAPAQPCLSSRIETGIRIDADDLRFVDSLEHRIRALGGPATVVRVRVRTKGISVETGDGIDAGILLRIAEEAERFCREQGRCFTGLVPYRQGSAFIAKETA